MRSRSRASSREVEDRVLDVDPLPRMGTTETPDSPPSITHHEEQVPTTATDEPRSEEDSELADPPKPQRMSFSFMAGIGVSVAVVVAAACLFLLRSDDLLPGEKRPAAQHFRGIPQMSTPDKSNSTWATVDYAEHGGKVVKLKYDVSHPPVTNTPACLPALVTHMKR